MTGNGTLRFVDFDRLPQNLTMGLLNTRSLTDVRRRARELTPRPRKGKFVKVQSIPKGPTTKTTKCVGSCVDKPTGQTPGELSRDYSQAILVGDDRRYKELNTPKDDTSCDLPDGSLAGLRTNSRHSNKLAESCQHVSPIDSNSRLE